MSAGHASDTPGPPIRGEHLVLRDVASTDLDAMHRYASDPAVTRNLCWEPHEREQTRAFIEQARQHRDASPRSHFDLVIERTADLEVIGGCGIRAKGGDGTWEIGYTLRRDCWGLGHGTEAVRELVEFGLRVLKARRIVAEVFVGNRGSSRILEKIGFRGLRRTDRYIAARGGHRRIVLYELKAT